MIEETLMSIQPESTTTQLLIKVGLLPANLQAARPLDIAIQKEVGKELVAAFEQEGQFVEPAITDQKAGDFLIFVHIINQAVLLAREAWQYSVLMGQNVETLEHLWTVFTIATGVIGKIQQVWKPRQLPAPDPQKTLHIRIEVDGATIELEADADKKADQEMARQLIQQYIQRYPEQAKQVNERSQIVVHGILPAQEDESVL
jgi:hypothetical protein